MDVFSFLKLFSFIPKDRAEFVRKDWGRSMTEYPPRGSNQLFAKTRYGGSITVQKQLSSWLHSTRTWLNAEILCYECPDLELSLWAVPSEGCASCQDSAKLRQLSIRAHHRNSRNAAADEETNIQLCAKKNVEGYGPGRWAKIEICRFFSVNRRPRQRPGEQAHLCLF